MNADEYRKDIERKILEIIELRLKSGEMTADRAKKIAQYVLQLFHPPLTLDEIYIKVQNFDAQFPELIPARLNLVRDYDQKIKLLVERQAHKLMQENRLDEADSLLKKAINGELRLNE